MIMRSVPIVEAGRDEGEQSLAQRGLFGWRGVAVDAHG
jgi:hypothetical protein